MRGTTARESRRKRADSLTEERAKRSPQQQLELLDKRLGEGLGAKKERAKLQALINSESKQKSKKKADR
tara:strand:+ start:1190 stop:1396 length:207 start_codon:yes stop_codon:yes gene_type:complete